MASLANIYSVNIVNAKHTSCNCLPDVKFIFSYCLRIVLTFLHVSATYCTHHHRTTIL